MPSGHLPCNPLGVPVVPLLETVGKQIRTAQRKAAEARAREEVRRALEELLACRADPAILGAMRTQARTSKETRG